MDHVVGPLHILLAKKEGRIWFDIKCFKLYQFWENYLAMFVYLEIYLGIFSRICLAIYPEICLAGKKIKIVMVSWNSGRPWKLIHSPPYRTSCRLFIYEVFFGPLDLHLRVWSELGRSPPFWPMRALRLQWSRAFSLVCEVTLTCVYLTNVCWLDYYRELGIKIIPYRPLGWGFFSGKAVVAELVDGGSRNVCYFYTDMHN